MTLLMYIVIKSKLIILIQDPDDLFLVLRQSLSLLPALSKFFAFTSPFPISIHPRNNDIQHILLITLIKIK